MGLEKHVDVVIDEAAPHLRHMYWWENGLKVDSKRMGTEICEVLNGSGEFGHAELVLQGYPYKIVFNEFMLDMH